MFKGLHFIGYKRSGLSNETFYSNNPATNTAIPVNYHEVTYKEIDLAVNLAVNAFYQINDLGLEKRRKFLTLIATLLEENDSQIINICNQETALPFDRLRNELNRTVGQIRLFAELLSNPWFLDIRIDYGNPDRKPVPKHDIRQMQIPLGPVAVFGASNFPLAFSVAGGDTISALAAGCPVIFKAHPLHPATSEIVAELIIKAAQQTNMPEGIFNLIYCKDNIGGQMLVEHPDIKAVAFTGSFNGGKSIFDIAAKRKTPIPVFAEMGSINPVFIFAEAQKNNTDKLAIEIFNSLTNGCGQFCTNPGLIFIQESKDRENLLNRLTQFFRQWQGGIMLSDTIKNEYNRKINNIIKTQNVKYVSSSLMSENHCKGYIFIADFETYINDPGFNEEVFGPSGILILTKTINDFEIAVNNIQGVLSASIYSTEEKVKEYKTFIKQLSYKAGRINFNNMPTGVEVGHAIVHGGPFPATTNSQYTSVGSASIKRFLRPVCFQNFPENAISDYLWSDNKYKIHRLIDGCLKK
ncbi:MAG: aldehyde dehydrogenase (NADP(+)) [Marinilabiliales bacterium]